MNLKEKVEYYKRKLEQDPGNAEICYNLAQAYSDITQWDEAITFYQKAIEIDCHHVKSYLELSNLLFSIDRIDKAVQVCQLGIDFNPESSTIYYLLEQLYEILGEYELASQTLEDLLVIDEGFNKAYEALGRLAILQNRYDEAKVWLEKLTQLEPENVNAYIYLANIYRKNKDFDQSIQYLRKAIEAEPDNLDIYNDLGLLYLEFGNYEEAKKNFEFVITEDESYSFAYDNLGVIYRKLKEYKKAEACLKKSLALNLQAWTYNELALVYTEMGQYRDSIDSSKKALAIDTNYAFAYDNLGAVYRKLGYYEKAREALQQSLELKPEDSWTYNQLGLLNYENGKYITAKADFIKSAELDHDHYWPHINLASCYVKEKEYKLAENYLKELEEKYPDNARVYMLESRLKHALEDVEAAMQYAFEAIEKDPADPLTHANLGYVYREADEYEKADQKFVDAISCPRPKDSSVYLEYALLNIYRGDFAYAFDLCLKARDIDEINYNIYCIMAIIENASDVETKLLDYIKEIEKDFPNAKEVFMSYACSFLELGLPEESEKYFNLACRVMNDYSEAQYGIAQTYYQMKLYEQSIHHAFMNTDNTENIELASYNNALVALNYKMLGQEEKFEKYKKEALQLNPTIKKELYQKYRIRQELKNTTRSDFFKHLSELF
jgi:tetratricopeptide (TPR) repeat protein